MTQTPQTSRDRPPVSAQCPACGLHELVVVQLRKDSAGNWLQIGKFRLFHRARHDADAVEIHIDACPICFGAWFDAGELDALAGDLDAVETILDPERGASTRPCPHGHGAMVEHNVSGFIKTPLDRCSTCGGLWLDGHERRKLARASTSEGQGSKTERWLRRGSIWAAQVLTHLPVEVDNPARGTPWIVLALLAGMLAMFGAQELAYIDTHYYGLVSERLPREGDWDTLFSYMWLHASWPHILGNAYFLYMFGDNIEHLFGRIRFALFFIAAGVTGGLLHALLAISSATPVVGASGAIAGILGAYLWAFPRQRLFQVVLWIQLAIPAWSYLFVWIGFNVVMARFATGDAAGVAWWAHVGGFALGLTVTPLVLKLRRREIARIVRVPAMACTR